MASKSKLKNKCKNTSKYESKVKSIGLILILLGIILNPSVIENIFSQDKNIGTITLLSIILFDVAIILVGFFLYIRPDRLKETLISIITLAVCLVLLEAGTRVYMCNFADYSTQSRFLSYGQCGVESLYEPHHYLNYQGTPNYESPDGLNMHNSYGFRGPEITVPKPEKTYRIVTLGGSTTYTIDVKDWRLDFARQLERELKIKYNYEDIEVVNAGLNSYNSWESLINLEFKVLDLEPDMIIIYHGINDVHTRLVNPKLYKGDNSGRRKQWEPRPIPLIFHSLVVRLLTGINPSGLGQFVDAPTSAAGIEEDKFSDILGGKPSKILQINKPVYFERNLRNMIAVAQEYDVDVLLATFAYSEDIDDFAGSPHYQSGLKENNEVVKEVGKNHGVPVYDFYSEMPMDDRFSTDGRHMNEEGSKLKGKLFANFIHSNKMMDERINELKINSQS